MAGQTRSSSNNWPADERPECENCAILAVTVFIDRVKLPVSPSIIASSPVYSNRTNDFINCLVGPIFYCFSYFRFYCLIFIVLLSQPTKRQNYITNSGFSQIKFNRLGSSNGIKRLSKFHQKYVNIWPDIDD